ncbi:undecaprenyl-diphosphate phosphatase [Patescibacteria group bacterium]|nr:undecaprenyl-diphosphate phosphatase [Patescibacteria group bacterium]MBU1721482.1 undecaprenyl-diphosphate phosphatase [Patescibacteria group bacterium]MBU1900751.1 undecaprenyl-diphosphate phosphatase [Patescibacteria group bacterium]
MTILQAIILGVIQGIAEFLPISSSGHLIFLPQLFGWQDQGIAFDAIVHLGTLGAVVVYFRKKIMAIIQSCMKRGVDDKLNQRLAILIILSIIPAGIVGLFGKSLIEENLRSVSVIAFGLIFWGIVMFFGDRLNQKWKKEGKELVDINHLSGKQMLFVACAQAIALIPGTSRSGITMTAGLFAGLDKKAVAEFSFLMSIPIIALAGGLKVLELIQSGMGDLTVTVLFVGFIASALSGFVAIAGLMKIVQKWNFTPFVIYRIVLGIALISWIVM